VIFAFGFELCYHTPSLIQSKIEITIQFSLSKHTRLHRPKFEHLSEVLEKFFDVISIVLGPNIDCPILTSFSRNENRREVFFGDFDKTVTIVSFEQAVEWWLMLFDKIGFEIQSFAFVVDTDVFDMVCSVDHLLFPYGSGRKILLYSFVQILRLPNIQNSSRTILEYIDTWFVGDMGYGEHK